MGGPYPLTPAPCSDTRLALKDCGAICKLAVLAKYRVAADTF
jgi:hypothetical protein